MEHIAEYEHAEFDNLPGFDTAAHALVRFESDLGHLAKVVAGHDADDRVGLALLHRHFPLSPEERLVETVNRQQRVSIGVPARPHDRAMPHLFKARLVDGTVRWYPLEFVDVTECPEVLDTYEWFAEQHELLHDVAHALSQSDALDVFGLSLSHGREEIPCTDEEVLVEETDETTRTLILRPRGVDGLRGTTTPTNWSVHGGTVRMRCTCQRDQSGSHQHFETN